MLKASEWKDLIMEHMDKIKEAGFKAYKDSMDDPNSGWSYQVELFEDGDIDTVFLQYNSQLMSNYNGSSITVLSFSCENFEFNPEQCESFEYMGLTKDEVTDFTAWLIKEEEIEKEEDDTQDDIEYKALRKAYMLNEWNEEVYNRLKTSALEEAYDEWKYEAVDQAFENTYNNLEAKAYEEECWENERIAREQEEKEYYESIKAEIGD